MNNKLRSAGSSCATADPEMPGAFRTRDDTLVYSEEVRDAFAALSILTDEQRLDVMCWFCRGCGVYMPPGRYCQCQNDE